MQILTIKRVLFLLVCTLSISTALQAQDMDFSNLSKDIPFNEDVRTGTLGNGLKYYVKHNDRPADKVELRLVVNAGSILEKPNQQGLAHFMEHMNFNGTKNFEKNELVDYLQSIGVKFGADLNAYTSFDETVFILPIPSDDKKQLDQGFQIIEDWAHNAKLEEHQIDDERGVVLEEYRLGQGAGKRMQQDYLPKVLYKSRYADRLPIGTKKNLENFDYDDIRSFYRTWYRPDLMAVVAIGDADPAMLEKKIKSHFSGIENPDNAPERKTYDLPNHKKTLIAITSDPEASSSSVRLMYKDKENRQTETSLKNYRHGILERLFSKMINNRLNDLTNQENPPFVYAGSYHGGTSARSKEAYQSSASTKEGGQIEALKSLLIENERVKQHGFTKAEFERAKTDILAGMESSYKNRDKRESGRLVGEFIRNFLEDEPVPGIEWEYKFYENQMPAIKLDEVNNLIDKYLHKDNRVVVITGPESGDQPTKKEVRQLLKEVPEMDIAPYTEDEVAAHLMSKMPKAGSIAETESNAKLGTTTLTLSNGVKVTYKQTDFKNDEVLLSAFKFGGTSLYDLDTYKKTSAANGGLTEAGINGFDQNTMKKMMSGKIVSVSPRLGTYNEGFSGKAAPKDLETMFQMIYSYATNLNKDQSAFNSYINKRKARYSQMMKSPQIQFYMDFYNWMYEDNPRFTGILPTEKQLNEADYDLAYNKYQERFANANGFHFYFVGNLDKDKIESYAEQYLASLPATEEKENYETFDFRPRHGKDAKTIEAGTDPKSMVQMIYQGPTDYSSEEDLAMGALGQALNIKMIENIREKEGGAYSVNASGDLSNFPYDWYQMNVRFPCGPENVDKLVEEAKKVVHHAVKNGPTQVDLDKVKETLKKEHKEKMKENKYWLNVLENTDQYDRDPMRAFTYNNRVDALTVEQLHEVAKKYLDNDNFILAVKNPESGSSD